MMLPLVSIVIGLICVLSFTADPVGAWPAGTVGEKVEIRDAQGNELYAFKSKKNNALKVYDAQGVELCKFTLDGPLDRPTRLKANSADDIPLFELKAKKDKIMLKDATGETELYKIKRKDKRLDLYAADERRLYRLQNKPQKGESTPRWQLQDKAKTVLYRAKSRDGKLVLRNSLDQTVLSSKDVHTPLALLFFGIPELTLEQRLACFVFFSE